MVHGGTVPTESWDVGRPQPPTLTSNNLTMLQNINGNILNFSQFFLYSNNAKCKQQFKTTAKNSHLSDISVISFSLD